MPKSGRPVTMAGLSTPEIGRPMILKSFGSFNLTDAKSGAGSAAALGTSWAYVNFRPVGPWTTVPDIVEHSDSGTFQV